MLDPPKQAVVNSKDESLKKPSVNDMQFGDSLGFNANDTGRS